MSINAFFKMSMNIKCKLEGGAIMPIRKTPGSAGYDLFSTSRMILPPGKHTMVTTGVCLEIPDGFYAQIFGKSTLALKYGINPLGGVVDGDYRGPIMVILANFGRHNFEINEGDPIAQFIILPYSNLKFELVSELSHSDRSDDPPLSLN